MTEINKADRIVNLFIDSMIIGTVVAIVSPFLSNLFLIRFTPGIVLFLYYFILEATVGRTIGKMATGTIVKSTKNKTPSVW